MKELLKDSNKFIRARAIWLLSKLGEEGKKAVLALAESGEAQTRIVAFRALRRVNYKFLKLAELFSKDSNPALRREAAVAMRDVPFEQAKQIILNIASRYDGADRTYLEALGKACSLKEEVAFSFLAAQMKQSAPLSWSDQFEGIAWRYTRKLRLIYLKPERLQIRSFYLQENWQQTPLPSSKQKKRPRPCLKSANTAATSFTRQHITG